MKNNSYIPILATSNIFDSTISKLPEEFKIYHPKDLSTMAPFIQGIMTSFSTPINSELINNLPNLKIISCFGTGTDNVDTCMAKSKTS